MGKSGSRKWGGVAASSNHRQRIAHTSSTHPKHFAKTSPTHQQYIASTSASHHRISNDKKVQILNSNEQSADPSGSRRIRIDGSSCPFQYSQCPNSPILSQLPDNPGSACLRLPDSQILWFLRFSGFSDSLSVG